MSAKVAAYPVQGKNSMTYMTKIGQHTKPRKKQNRTAKKNT